MRRTLWTGILLLLAAGCASESRLEWPELPSFGVTPPLEMNPLYIPEAGPKGLSMVYETALKALHDAGFEILESNRLEGRIETLPRVAPGVGLILKAGSPVFYERVLATLQSYRHRAIIKLYPAQDKGFFVQVTVLKELEDLPRPGRATAGAVLFHPDNDVERRFQVVDPTIFESNWIPEGNDIPIEQSILRQIKGCL